MRAALAGAAAAITVAVAATPVLLGVHWVTDVVGGVAVGWSVFAATALAFGGRLLHFGAPAEQLPRTDTAARTPYHVRPQPHTRRKQEHTMNKIAVVAHSKKQLGAGLMELRDMLAHEGSHPLWFEVPKSKPAPGAAQAEAEGADLVLVWGGDGTVHRCSMRWPLGQGDGILPAGTANLLATNLGIPTTSRLVEVGLHGHRHSLDSGGSTVSIRGDGGSRLSTHS